MNSRGSNALIGMLMNSTNERKALGFQLINVALPFIKDSDVSILFTKTFLRTLINQASKKDNNLHEDARKCLVDLTTFCENNKQVTLQVLLALLGGNGNRSFDQLTRTKTVEKLLGCLDTDSIMSFCECLVGVFLEDDG